MENRLSRTLDTKQSQHVNDYLCDCHNMWCRLDSLQHLICDKLGDRIWFSKRICDHHDASIMGIPYAELRKLELFT